MEIISYIAFACVCILIVAWAFVLVGAVRMNLAEDDAEVYEEQKPIESYNESPKQYGIFIMRTGIWRKNRLTLKCK